MKSSPLAGKFRLIAAQAKRWPRQETAVWEAKSYHELIAELADVVAFQRGNADDFHQFEVMLLEKTGAYVHVSVSIDDGSFLRSFAPLTSDFIIHKSSDVDL